ncbi:MAG TPA: carboxypeptidase regulatory-like domain-containing protein [Pyrinomonadaceae bacterium]|nr:carboxypeptidase regulatory-like domain-containing protein [Pyrinomonadaceae bacterium]
MIRSSYLPKAIFHCLLLLALLLSTQHSSLSTAFGQSATATLSGTVEDQNSAVVPGAKVKIINLATGLEREVTTNDSGSFTVPLLPPSAYTVRVERENFAPVELQNVILNVGDQRALAIQLKPGSISEMVQVVGDAPLINASPAVATTIDRQFVGNLPLNGRSFQSLILLTPGVVATTAGGGGDPGQFSVNGQRANSNYFTVDGVGGNIGAGTSAGSGTAISQGGALPGLTVFGGTNNLASIDALEEFTIQTSSYSAEFGRQPGGQITLITRAGTNKFHGTVFEYFRNDAMDARNYFNRKPAPKAPLRQNQFGGTFSGPVLFPRLGEGGDQPAYHGRNRTFFFFSYEGLRLRLPTSGITNVPSIRLRQVASPTLHTILNSFPVPTGEELRGTSGQPLGFAPYNFAISDPITMDATSIRVDHTIGGKFQLFGRYNESPSSSTTHSVLITPTQTTAVTRTFTLGLTSALTPELNNEFRFNHSRQIGAQSNIFDPLGGAIPVDVSAVTSGYTGGGARFGSASINFGGGLSSFLQLGNFADSNQRQINFVDNLSLVKKGHRLKFGFDYRRLANTYAPRDYQQSSSFSSETDIRTGIVSSVIIAATQGARPWFHNFSFYNQDTWNVSRRLTLDLGLRWELNPAPEEVNGKRPAMAIGIDNLPTATLAPPDAPFYRTSYTAFAPRVGGSYLLREAMGRETVLRGGFGFYYDLGSGQATTGFLTAVPSRVTRSLSRIPYPLSTGLAQPPTFPEIKLPISGTVISLDPHLRLPYSLQWNAALEQSLGTQQSVSVSYVASAGRRLLVTQRLNQPAGVSSGTRPNPNFNGTIVFTTNGPTSDYNSLQVQLRRRLSRRLQALANYTWSHAIDEVSDEINGNLLERGNASFDVRHNFSAAVTYFLPAAQTGGVIKRLLDDWSVHGVVHAQSGRPIDLTAGSFVRDDGTLFTVRPDVVEGVQFNVDDSTVPGGRRFNASAFKSPPRNPAFPSVPARQGTFGRNILRELPIFQVDLALARTLALSEQLKLQFRAEAYNVFNHPIFASYGTAFTSPSTFGVPASTLNIGLGGLSPLYQLGGPRSIQLSLRLSF